jgi:hypothetical protein
MCNVGLSQEGRPFGDVIVKEGCIVCFVEEIVNYHDRPMLWILLRCQLRSWGWVVPQEILHLGFEDVLYLLEVSC